MILQVHRFPNAIDPCNPLKPNGIVFGFGTPRGRDAFEHLMLEHIWLRNLYVRRMRTGLIVFHQIMILGRGHDMI